MTSSISGSVPKGSGRLKIKEKTSNSNPASGYILWNLYAIRHGDAAKGVALGGWHLEGEVRLRNGVNQSFGNLFLDPLFLPNGFSANDIVPLQREDRDRWILIVSQIAKETELSIDLP